MLKDLFALYPPPGAYSKEKDINQYLASWTTFANYIEVQTAGQELPKLNESLAMAFSTRCGRLLSQHAEDLIAAYADDMPDLTTFIDFVRDRFSGDAGGMTRELELNKLFIRDKNTNITKYFELFDATTRTLSHLSPEVLAFIFRMGLPTTAVNAVMRSLYASRRQDEWKDADVQHLKQFVLQFDTDSPRKDDKPRQDNGTPGTPNGDGRNNGKYKKKTYAYDKAPAGTTPGQAQTPTPASSNTYANNKPLGNQNPKPNQQTRQQPKGSVGTITQCTDIIHSDVEHSDGQEFVSIPTSLPTRSF
jgi:hypothetical protein